MEHPGQFLFEVAENPYLIDLCPAGLTAAIKSQVVGKTAGEQHLDLVALLGNGLQGGGSLLAKHP